MGEVKQLSSWQKLLAVAHNTCWVLQTYKIQRTFFRIPTIDLADSSQLEKKKNCPKKLLRKTARKMIIKALQRRIHASTKAVSAHTAEIVLSE